MSDADLWNEQLDDLPPLDTEEGRDRWAEHLLTVENGPDGDWVEALLVQDGENMVARFKMPDGSQVVMDLVIRREIAVVHVDENALKN